MEVRIDPALKETVPALRLGCLEYEAAVRPGCPAMWDWFEEKTLPALRAELAEHGLGEIEGIRSSREAYKAFGMSPSRYRVSSESLIRRLRQGKALYRVNTVVDVNNLLSVETGLSVGSYDTGCIAGGILLSVGRAGERYTGIGKGELDLEHMILIRDGEGPLGSPTSDSARAMIQAGTTQVLTLLYCFSSHLDLPAMLDRGEAYLEKFAGAAQIRKWVVA